MITKAYIQEVLSKNSVRVRIPLYHKIESVNGATDNYNLPVASISIPPNISVDPSVGDIVIVGFEEGDLAHPIVLGYLSLSTENSSMLNILCEDLVVRGESKFSKDITVGDILYKNIECLKDQETNIKDSFKILSDKDEEIEGALEETNNTITQNYKDFVDFKDDTNSALSSLDGRVDSIEGIVSSLPDNYVSRSTPTFIKGKSYGTEMPKAEDMVEGQIFFLLLDSYESEV